MDPSMDHQIIQETLHEARLCDALGMEMLWLAEHHFDGICAYVDPVTFAAAPAARHQRPHPERLRGGADVAAPSDPPGRANGADRQYQPGTPGRRPRPWHRLQY